jgi:hypothetical protein
VDVFMNVKEVANDNELLLSSYNVPSVFIKSLTVSGK